ncbi:potassium channel family protein [Nocardia sp. NPDC051750]|uniref:potassium channel family protein n=1 Tax=Nocardia sp. NPDC051750 TaxID=3364325 RepID=UPI0037A11FC7
MASRRISGRAHLWRNAGTVVFALLFYYFVPLGFDFPGYWPLRVVTVVAFTAGVAGLAWLAYRRLGQFLIASRDTGHRVDGLLFLVSLVVVFFALFYYVLELRDPGQFTEMRTRSDALYYTVATLGTVGFGDIHAAGQAARIATTVQMAFDLVFIGTLVTVMSTGITRRLDAADVTGPR